MKRSNFLMLLMSASLLLGVSGCNKQAPTSSSPTTSSESEPSSESIDYGTLTIQDINVVFMNEVIINPVFSKEEYEETVNYSFEGNNISISQGKVKGLVPNTTTVVSASTSKLSTTFNVRVEYVAATLTNDTGAESKFTVPTPEAGVSKYLVHFDVEAELFIEQYTRLSSFAFNASNNSWYNIEMGGDGNVHLFAHFNNIEKYWIFLGNKNDLMVDNKIQYHIDILRNGQATYLLFNGQMVTGFSDKEMTGYAQLGALEVTAAADRDGAGKYIINLKNVYYELESSPNYQKFIPGETQNIPDAVLQNNTGAESKIKYGYIALHPEFIYSTTVDVETWSNVRTRPVAFAFNGSDNSWYNIEMGDDGAMHLFGRFNNVEKYWIYLGNKADFMQNEKIHFTVSIMKKGQSSFYFFNEKLVCWFTETELQGYANLETFEVTAATNVWASDPYKVNLSNTKFETGSSDNYIAHMNKIYKDYGEVILDSADGNETRVPEIAATDKMVFTTKVVVTKDSTGWFRPSAFAFNNSDQSWYNIETGTDGNVTLFARFNNHEKYWISLGTKSDSQEDGKFAYEVAILKINQASYFFYNGVLKASFDESELSGYRALFALNVTSCADRDHSAYTVKYEYLKVEDENSNTYAQYQDKIANL